MIGWINIYKPAYQGMPYQCSEEVYKTEDEAKLYADPVYCVDTIQIEYCKDYEE